MKVTDLEDSKRLQEAGIEGDPHHYWASFLRGNYIEETIITKERFNDLVVMYQVMDNIQQQLFPLKAIPAYSLEELLDMVEGNWYLEKEGNMFSVGLFLPDIDPKKAIVEALLWQKGEGR